MTPVKINACFGIVHGDQSWPTGIILLPGLRSDELHGYDGLRQMAESFAENNYPTLRFHYASTGNSLDAGEQEYWSYWKANIHEAINWLIRTYQVKGVILVGLRFGSLLAASIAAERNDIAGLILLQPIWRGRSYLSRLVVEMHAEADKPIPMGRFYFSLATRKILQDLALQNMTPPKHCRVLILSTDSGSTLTSVTNIWQAAGVDVTTQPMAQLDFMLRPTFNNDEERPDMTCLIDWIGPSTHDSEPVNLKQDCVLEGAHFSETPLVFGEDDLFGILCTPKQPVSRTVVLMGNASADPHCSASTVGLARQLAAQGIYSLRFDFAGIADSVHDNQHTHIFAVPRAADFAQAADKLFSLGFERFATQGLCSGAYHAYHGAMGYKRINAVLAINMPFFEWVPGPLEYLDFNVRPPSALLEQVKTKEFWRNVVYKATHNKINYKHYIGMVLHKVLRRPNGMRQVAEMPHVHMQFLCGETDKSRSVLAEAFSPRPPSQIEIVVMSDLNHAMTTAAMWASVAIQMAAFLTQETVEPSSEMR